MKLYDNTAAADTNSRFTDRPLKALRLTDRGWRSQATPAPPRAECAIAMTLYLMAHIYFSMIARRVPMSFAYDRFY